MIVYFPNNSYATAKNTLKGAATARRLDPRSGTEAQAGAFAPGETRGVIPPEGWEDAILVIRME